MERRGSLNYELYPPTRKIECVFVVVMHRDSVTFAIVTAAWKSSTTFSFPPPWLFPVDESYFDRETFSAKTSRYFAKRKLNEWLSACKSLEKLSVLVRFRIDENPPIIIKRLYRAHSYRHSQKLLFDIILKLLLSIRFQVDFQLVVYFVCRHLKRTSSFRLWKPDFNIHWIFYH